jgi:hypothetical protein
MANRREHKFISVVDSVVDSNGESEVSVIVLCVNKNRQPIPVPNLEVTVEFNGSTEKKTTDGEGKFPFKVRCPAGTKEISGWYRYKKRKTLFGFPWKLNLADAVSTTTFVRMVPVKLPQKMESSVPARITAVSREIRPITKSTDAVVVFESKKDPGPEKREWIILIILRCWFTRISITFKKLKMPKIQFRLKMPKLNFAFKLPKLSCYVLFFTVVVILAVLYEYGYIR